MSDLTSDSGNVEDQPTCDLAEPWRRLAASATDAFILLAANILLATCALSFGALGEGAAMRLGWWSLGLGWAYVFIGWGFFGATLGKAIWHIRIVPLSGGRMTPARGALRCLGYVPACVPLRLGLLAIIWDARRQGWHDRLAGTVVVKASAASAGYRRPDNTPAYPEPIIPDLSAPRRHWWAPRIAYTVLALGMTYPLVLHFGTHRAGPAGDGSVAMWNLWLFADALRSGKPLTTTDLVYHPYGVSLLYHAMDWFDCALAVPLLRFFSLTVTYNVVLLFTLVACSYAMYWTACALTRCRLASAVAGLVFGFSPFFAAHCLGHLNVISAQFIPLFCLFLVSALARCRVLPALAAGICLALIGLCDWYYFVFALIAAACVAVGVQVSHRPWSWATTLRRACLLVLAMVTGLALLSPLVVPMLATRGNSHYMDLPVAVTESFKADLTDFLRPGLLHPLMRGVPAKEGLEWVITPGLVALGLAVLGLWRRWRLLLPWVLIGGCGVVLACGPSLSVGGRNSFNELALFALGGVPGSGLDPPWTTQPMMRFSLAFLANPGRVPARATSVTLPFDWLAQHVPAMRPLKVPSRLCLLATMSCSVFAAFGLTALYGRWRRRWGLRSARLLVLGVTAAILFEYLMAPYPLFATAVHPFYRQLAANTADFAVIEVPLVRCIGEYQFYQTVHHKRLFRANLSRIPPQAMQLLEQNWLLYYLEPAGSADDTPDLTKLNLVEARRASEDAPGDRLELAAALAELRHLRTGYIIVHKQLLEAESLQATRTLLANDLGLPLVLDDDELVVFMVRDVPAK